MGIQYFIVAVCNFGFAGLATSGKHFLLVYVLLNIKHDSAI